MKIDVYGDLCEVGKATGVLFNGEMLYTGDEVVDSYEGKLGVILERSKGKFEIVTNKEIGRLVKKEFNKNTFKIEEVVKVLSVVRKYSDLKVGDMVVKGYKAGVGFNVLS